MLPTRKIGSLLLESIKSKNVDVNNIKLLLETNVDLEVVDQNGNNALINIIKSKAFARKDKIELISKILDRAPNLVNVIGEYNTTPLIHAILAADLEIVTLLLQKGADILAKDIGGNNIIAYAFTRKNDEIAKKILEKLQSQKIPPEKIVDMINEKVLYPLAGNEDEESLLSINIKSERLSLVALLVKNGADLSLVDKEIIAGCQNREILEIIDPNGEISTEVENKIGKDDQLVIDALFRAVNSIVKGKKADQVIKTLGVTPKLINAQDSKGKTLLARAVNCQNEEGNRLFNYLIDAGAKLDVVDEFEDNIEETILVYAARTDNILLLEKIISVGEKNYKNVGINFKDKNGYTALKYAVNNNNLNMVKFLIKNYASLGELYDQESALKIAEKKSSESTFNKEILKVLESASADYKKHEVGVIKRPAMQYWIGKSLEELYKQEDQKSEEKKGEEKKSRLEVPKKLTDKFFLYELTTAKASSPIDNQLVLQGIEFDAPRSRYAVFVIPARNKDGIQDSHACATIVDREYRKIYYIDPQGKKMHHDHQNALDRLFKGYRIIHSNIKQQEDELNCELYTLNNIIEFFQGTLFDEKDSLKQESTVVVSKMYQEYLLQEEGYQKQQKKNHDEAEHNKGVKHHLKEAIKALLEDKDFVLNLSGNIKSNLDDFLENLKWEAPSAGEKKEKTEEVEADDAAKGRKLMDLLNQMNTNDVTCYIRTLLKELVMKEEELSGNIRLIVGAIDYAYKMQQKKDKGEEEEKKEEKKEEKSKKQKQKKPEEDLHSKASKLKSAIMLSLSYGEGEEYKDASEVLDKIKQVESYIVDGRKEDDSLDDNQNMLFRYLKNYGKELYFAATNLIKKDLEVEIADSIKSAAVKELPDKKEKLDEETLKTVALRAIELPKSSFEGTVPKYEIEKRISWYQQYEARLRESDTTIKEVLELGLLSKEEVNLLSMPELGLITDFCNGSKSGKISSLVSESEGNKMGDWLLPLSISNRFLGLTKILLDMNAVDLYAGYKSEEYKKRVSDLIYDAIKCGGPAMMEILIEALKKQERTEDNLKSIIEGDVKLLFAAVESNKYVVRILLENGANPNNMRLTDQTYYTPLIIASFIPGRFDVVKTLLEWSNAQENPQDKININAVAECITGNSSFESNTALYCASKDKRTFKLLLDNGADPTVGESVLVEVATKGNIELIDMVLDWSPKDKDSGKKVDINEIGVGGTALMKAVKHGHIKATQHLLERGADPTIVYKKNTALILAEQSQNPDLIKLISEAWLKKKEQDSIKLSKSSLSTSSFSTLQTLGKENTLGQSPVR